MTGTDQIAEVVRDRPNDRRRQDDNQWRRRVTGIVLACIIAAYVLSIIQLHPTNLFGLTGDDGIYMSSAKALAEGKGYLLPNLPGSPPATKYPVLYPWMLSFVWRINPVFPANLPLAISISVAFGIAFLLAAFAMFSSLGGFSKAEALTLTAYLALHPLVMFYGASVLSEMPFAFFALASMVVAERVIRPSGGNVGSAGCGALAGIATLTRVLGFPIILGILVTGIVRRSWRQVATFSLAAVPFVGAAAWNAIFSKKPASPIADAAGASLGWTHAWTFYTDYAGIWKLGVPNLHIFWAMLKNNAGMILREPADLMLGPSFVHDTMAGRILVLLMAVATVAGIVRQGREHGWKPIHFSFVFYAPIVLLWNYPAVDRFFLPFWALQVAGVWVEGKRVLQLVKSTISGSHKFPEKCIGGAVGCVIVALACMAGENSIGGIRTVVKRTSSDRSEVLRDKQECYEWVRNNTAAEDRLVAYEDAPTYLYTGRVTVRPMIFTTDEFYETSRLNQESSHVADVAQAVRARYWLFASDDYYRDWPAATALEQNRLGELEEALPVVFRGSRGAATVRSAECISQRCESACSSCEQSPANRQVAGKATTPSAVSP